MSPATHDWSDRVAALGPGQLLTVIGLSAESLRVDIRGDQSVARRMLQLDFGDADAVNGIIERILDDLAELALALWPDWYRGDSIAEPDPEVLAIWRREAIRVAEFGRPPRFRGVPASTELRQLLAALDPSSLILVAQIDTDSAERAAGRIAALEWCARSGASVVILCPRNPNGVPPFDRILYGAVEIAPQPAATALNRLVLPASDSKRGSIIEKRMREALSADCDLAGLFEDEVTIRLGPLGPTPRVDMLWRTGKIVVELDGAEHERDPTYGADRHRDYELMVAGYLVLRLTNAEVELDLARSIEKVRRVVNLRRGSAT